MLNKLPSVVYASSLTPLLINDSTLLFRLGLVIPHYRPFSQALYKLGKELNQSYAQLLDEAKYPPTLNIQVPSSSADGGESAAKAVDGVLSAMHTLKIPISINVISGRTDDDEEETTPNSLLLSMQAINTQNVFIEEASFTLTTVNNFPEFLQSLAKSSCIRKLVLKEAYPEDDGKVWEEFLSSVKDVEELFIERPDNVSMDLLTDVDDVIDTVFFKNHFWKGLLESSNLRQNLKTLGWRHVRFQSGDLSPLADILAKTNITELVLTDVEFTKDELKRVLTVPGSKLTKLSLIYTREGTDYMMETNYLEQLASILKEAKDLHTASQITHLTIKGVQMDVPLFDFMALPSLRYFKATEFGEFWLNFLMGGGKPATFAKVVCDSGLTELDLSGNSLGGKVLEAIVQELKTRKESGGEPVLKWIGWQDDDASEEDALIKKNAKVEGAKIGCVVVM